MSPHFSPHDPRIWLAQCPSGAHHRLPPRMHEATRTSLIYVHHVPQIDAADRLSSIVAIADAPVEIGQEVAMSFALTGDDAEGTSRPEGPRTFNG